MDVKFNRRDFMSTSSGVIVGASLVRLDETNGNNNTKAILSSDAVQKSTVNSRTHDLSLSVNNEQHSIAIDVRTTLLDLLREQLALTGTKKGCDHGACGACTVHVGGKCVLACLTLAATLQNAEITTIEGVADNGELQALQRAFVVCEGFQCGYCTPGQIMSGLACIQEGHIGSEAEIQEWMSGNLCRCGAYPNIVDAITAMKIKDTEA